MKQIGQLIQKDIAEHWKTYLALIVTSFAAALAADSRRVGPLTAQLIDGFLSGLLVSAGFMAACLSVQSERKGKAFLFLRSLPLSSRELIWAKFLLCLSVTAAVLLTSRVPELLAAGRLSGMSLDPMFWAALFIAFGLFMMFTFQNLAVAVLPLYVAVLLLMVAGEELNAFLQGAHAPFFEMAAVAASILLLEITVRSLRRKEIEL